MGHPSSQAQPALVAGLGSNFLPSDSKVRRRPVLDRVGSQSLWSGMVGGPGADCADHREKFVASALAADSFCGRERSVHAGF